MTAIDEALAAAGTPKSTRDGSRPSVGEATRSLSLPQLPYADAVLAQLDAAGMPPVAVEVGVRDLRLPELFMRFVWPVGTDVLADGVRDVGLTIAWSHVTGWSAHNLEGAAELLDVDALVAPRVIALAALDLAEQDLSLMWSPPGGTAGRWSQAVYLDIALVNFDEREVCW